MTGGQDRTINLWNPFRSAEDDMSKGFLIQSYTGPHGYEVRHCYSILVTVSAGVQERTTVGRRSYI